MRVARQWHSHSIPPTRQRNQDHELKDAEMICRMICSWVMPLNGFTTINNPLLCTISHLIHSLSNKECLNMVSHSHQVETNDARHVRSHWAPPQSMNNDYLILLYIVHWHCLKDMRSYSYWFNRGVSICWFILLVCSHELFSMNTQTSSI